MSLLFHGDSADWLFHDSPPSGSESWHELHQLAERAGVSVEHLCATVETATHFTHTGKATSSPSSNDDLDEVIRTLADDDYGFELELETKSEWHEADHPRGENGRFSSGGGHALEAEDTSQGTTELPVVDEAQALKELAGVHAALAKFYPDLPTRWSGKIDIRPKMALGANGLKSWICTISIAQEQFANPARKICSMIHESLHAFSPTSSKQYAKSKIWEEAVIENAVRVYRAEIAKQQGVVVTEEDFQLRDATHAYRFAVRSLERLRGRLGVADKRGFYDQLMRLPADQIETHLLSKAAQLSPKDREAFNRTFLFEKKILDGEWDAKNGKYKNVKTMAMKRDEVLFAVLYARNRESVAQAQKMRDEWVKLHPDDDEIFEAGEGLEMLAEAHAIAAAEGRSLEDVEENSASPST